MAYYQDEVINAFRAPYSAGTRKLQFYLIIRKRNIFILPLKGQPIYSPQQNAFFYAVMA